MSKKSDREVALLTELQEKHGYVLFRIKDKRERETTLMQHRNGTMQMTPATAVKLVIPTTSALAKAFATLYDAKPTKTKRGSR